MTEKIVTSNATAAAPAAPWHLWVVGVVSLLWNAFGAYDYLMTQTRNDAYMGQFTPDQLDYFYGFPAWMEFFWALGVWGAVAGSVLLLLRKRWAVHAFIVSLVGLVGSSIYSFVVNPVPESMGSAGYAVFTAVIFAVTLLLVWYSVTMVRKGVLR
ncbi:hypothetical protein [Sphingomicrobium astaxanthinifaciens]|uniref:hypothetical protein n=1 Tax=Sphingomicrobium astaxanthinifaciens TaxID=1227949 RepID=UPI001FCA68C5|nr:hypothetical protein [Sphingomicrobium astaxanthinifaciens]MCJ7421481.1 hypothetical protein [Sphingomicrobium astaxanthinifaciens]